MYVFIAETACYTRTHERSVSRAENREERTDKTTWEERDVKVRDVKKLNEASAEGEVVGAGTERWAEVQ